MRRRPARILPLAVSAVLAVFLGETLTARQSAAEVYKAIEASVGSMLAGIVGEPERRPRDLAVNGQPLRFTPYGSRRPVEEIADEWLAVLNRRAVPAVATDGDPVREAAAQAANIIVAPKIRRVSDEFATIVQFFDGNGPEALAYVMKHAPSELVPGAGRAAMPGVALTIRRMPGSPTTDVLMTDIADVPQMLQAYTAPVSASGLPAQLRPPPGGEVLSDIADRSAGHTSRTVVTSAGTPASRWADMRRSLLARAGFDIEAMQARGADLLALRGRRGATEADILYTPGERSGDVIEVVHIREPIIAGDAP